MDCPSDAASTWRGQGRSATKQHASPTSSASSRPWFFRVAWHLEPGQWGFNTPGRATKPCIGWWSL